MLTFQPIVAQSPTPKITWIKIVQEGVASVGISPDGKQVAFGNWETKQLTVMDWQTKQVVWQVSEYTDTASTSNWSPDGKYIAVLSGGSVYIYEASTGHHVSQIETAFNKYGELLDSLTKSDIGNAYTDLKWSSDGQKLAIMTHGYIIVYDIAADTVKTVVDLVQVESGDLHQYLSWFDWSSDSSKFAAFHYKADDKTDGRFAVFPLLIVVGFWDKNGYWLSQYEKPDASVGGDCVFNGEVQSPSLLPAFDVAWAPDNKTVGVSAGGYSVCTLQDNGNLIVHKISDSIPLQIHWTADKKWLIGFVGNCSLVISDVINNYATHLEHFGEPCFGGVPSWSHNDHYVVIGGDDGLWVGTVEFP
jgi:dipeptidyl aminopeptidase/acylaminoacyl peptidase